ncbi:hypothetical protein Pan44_34620 [Caulifigura coniformis]|uniref:Probable pectate lyase C n=1 Tax=Caulifigura coniformis TaxID=2527983 RepID=A0A517SH11_9PLAN|nr:hypothetical protein [Caulifigura coniformis]QDT55419.1 hypothetical protein Pan44_34620 [Caulifigura coniformis]
MIVRTPRLLIGSAFTVQLLAFVLSVVLAGAASTSFAATRKFAASRALGTGAGDSEANAARFADPKFWESVRQEITHGPLTVILLDGSYLDVVSLSSIGNADHRLTVESQRPGGALFAGPGRFLVGGGLNMTVRGLAFTETDPKANIYKLSFGLDSKSGRVSERVLIEDCLFHDSLVYYGTLGVHRGSHHVTIHRNTFRNIGFDGHAHMIYTAYDVHHIKVIGNDFQNCRGDYVRFRDNADFGEVRFNTFRSTEAQFNRPFIHIPVFNDVNPGDEFHASNYLFTDNRMEYESTAGSPDRRNAMGYLSSGFEPAHVHMLPTAAEGKVLQQGTTDAKRQLLLDQYGIDLRKVRVYRNEIQNQNRTFHYWANPALGAKSRGWSGFAEMADAINVSPPRPGDVHVDGLLDATDVAYFQRGLAASDERAFLLDDAIWFGDYQAADMNGDGAVNTADIPAFIERCRGHVPDEALQSLFKTAAEMQKQRTAH